MLKYPLTSLDKDQITRYSYDEEAQAQRVVISGVSNIQLGDFNFDTAKMEEILKDIQKNTEKLPKLPTDWPLTTMRMEEPRTIITTQPEVQIVEVPKIIFEEKIKIVEIEKPVFVKEQVTLEVPLVVKEYSTISIPESTYIKAFVVINSLATIGLLILNFIKR